MRSILIAAAAAMIAAGPAMAQTDGVTDTEIVIGGHHDLSGPFAAFSAPAVKAVQQIFKEVNDAGGIHGRKLRYVVEDHGYQVPKAVQAVNKLVNRDKVFAMLLSLGTPHNLAAFKLQDRKGIPNVNPLSAARQMLQEPLALHYAGTASYYDQLRAAVKWMHDNKGVKTVCSMYIPSDFGKEIQLGTKEEAEALGIKYAAETTHKPDETNYVGALGKLKAAGCQMISTALSIRGTITVVATAKKIGWNDVILVGSSAAFHTAIAKVPGGVTDGYWAAAGWQDLEARAGDPEVAKWIASYTKATGEKFPGTGALLGASGAHLMIRALEAAGRDLTHESFQKAMESLEFDDHIMGNHVKMGPGDHLAADTIYLSQIQNGSWKTIGEVKK